MDKITVKLPDFPKGKDYEEYIAAFFQSDGYYVERNIIDRDIEEILELDVIITDYDDSSPNSMLIEIKSGDWGFSDVFKVKGWLDYTGLQKGLFIVQKEKNHFSFYKKKAKELKIDLILNNDLDKTKENLSGIISPDRVNDADILIWRYAYWTERNLLKYLKKRKKNQLDLKCFKTLDNYYFKINCEIFFTPNRLKRIKQLYDAFQEIPNISAKTSHEIGGDSFEEEYEDISHEDFKNTYYYCDLNPIQVSTFIEHFARVTILKNCVDYLLFKEAGEQEKSDDELNFFGRKLSRLNLLPESLRNGLELISEDEYFPRYPIFWQWFLFVFGGFILKDSIDKEFELLSKKTGIPINQIEKAFKAYEILFPTNNGWMRDIPNTNIKGLKLFSVPFMGIGANFRRIYYAQTKSFDELDSKLNGEYTLGDLKKWNNLTVDLLKKY